MRDPMNKSWEKKAKYKIGFFLFHTLYIFFISAMLVPDWSSLLCSSACCQKDLILACCSDCTCQDAADQKAFSPHQTGPRGLSQDQVDNLCSPHTSSSRSSNSVVKNKFVWSFTKLLFLHLNGRHRSNNCWCPKPMCYHWKVCKVSLHILIYDWLRSCVTQWRSILV